MEKKKTKKKWREIRSAITMMCVMAAMLSTATYAWFTLTDSPTVTGLEMKAVSTGGLLVSDKSNTDFVNALDLPVANMNGDTEPLELQPVSFTSGAFSKPKYSGGKVTGRQDGITSGEDLKGLVAVYTYYIKAEEGTVGVGIISGDSTDANQKITVTDGVADGAGTFVRSNPSQTPAGPTGDAAASVRMGLVVTAADATPDAAAIANMIIIEPNTDLSNSGVVGKSFAEDTSSIAGPTADVDFTKAGVISTGRGTDDYTSEKLFEASTVAQKVTMYVWLEGTDADCIDQIKLDEIQAQIQFTVVESATP